MRLNQLPDEIIPELSVYELRALRRAPLKVNAREAVNPFWNKLGFAASPVQRRKKCLVVRIVWIYPEGREANPYTLYLPVVTVNIPLDPDDMEWILYIPFTAERRDLFRPFFDSTRVSHPKDIFSPIGLEDIRLAQAASAGVDHPRTKRNKDRIKFISDHRDLWHNPLEIAERMRSEGLSGTKAPVTQQIDSVKRIIRDLLNSQRTQATDVNSLQPTKSPPIDTRQEDE